MNTFVTFMHFLCTIVYHYFFSDEEKDICNQYFYYIAASRARLIKNLSVPLGALKGKECV
jgi:hypothetical protein